LGVIGDDLPGMFFSGLVSPWLTMR